MQEELKGKQAIAICIHDSDDSASSSVCEMMTRTMELGNQHLALQYGEAKKQPYQ